MKYQKILKMKVNLTTVATLKEKIRFFNNDTKGRYVCLSNVHMCMETYDDPSFENVVNEADITIPDGLPLVWAQKLLGRKEAVQIRGEDLVFELCGLAEAQSWSVGFYGSTEKVLSNLKKNLDRKFPSLKIPFMQSPPFRDLSEEENRNYIERIKASGLKILFVGLGCPKQEIWMYNHKSTVSCTMVGVGAAFDFIAGSKKNAPRWMRKVGLEWLFRLFSEPKRLWQRYLIHNPRFILLFLGQLLGKNYG